MSVFGNLDSHISILIPAIESLNSPKINPKYFKKNNSFLQIIKSIALALTKIQTTLSTATEKKRNSTQSLII